jgi:hypothetical protein
MALTITGVPDFHDVWGKFRAQGVLLQPSASDYVTGGYPITASQVELGKLIGASLLFSNPAGQLFTTNFVAQLNPISQAQTQVNMVVLSGGTQVAASTDLSGASFTALMIGW